MQRSSDALPTQPLLADSLGSRKRPVCNACASEVVRLRNVRSPIDGRYYALYECKRCRSRSFDAHEHQTDLAALYDSLAEASAQTYELPFQRSSYWSHEVAFIRRMLGREPVSVLDAGCRTGDFLLHWPETVRRVGVELSHRSAQIAGRRGLAVHEMQLEDLQIHDRFEIVTCYAILEHLTAPRQFLAKLADLVQEGGVLAVLVPSFETLKARALEAVGYRWHMYRPPEHLNLYSRPFLDTYLAQEGFSLVARRYTSGGTFNPLGRVPLLGKAFAKAMWLVDANSPLHLVPVFDHMYAYYRLGTERRRRSAQ